MTDHTYAGHTLAEIKAAAEAATPQNFDSAQEKRGGDWCDCPLCDGDGELKVESDYLNYDGVALGVQFYGIGPEHIAAEAFYRAANPATVLAMSARIEELEAELHRVTTEPPTGTAPCARLCEHTAFKSRHEQDKRAIAEREQQLADALRLVAEVRHACGDDGKRMLPELVQYVGELARDAARYRWLRDEKGRCQEKGGGRWCEPHIGFNDIFEMDVREYGESACVDAAIDAAMEQTKNREGA